LAREYVKFAAFVQQLHLDEQRRQKRIAAISGDGPRDARQPMDPRALAELVTMIDRADLSNVLRRQAVCAVVPGEAPKAIYREVYISIADLRDAVMPKRDLTSDRWLFQYLTQTLDRRVLALLRRNDDSALAHSYSVNLNISTCCRKSSRISTRASGRGRAAASSSSSRRSTSSAISARTSSPGISCASAAIASASTASAP